MLHASKNAARQIIEKFLISALTAPARAFTLELSLRKTVTYCGLVSRSHQTY
jgi:hypothetical protein